VTVHAGNGVADWDVIVIGSGIGGLVCAGYLAADGRRVLVLEQHDVAGGNGHVFRRRRAYEFDVGVHYLGDCGPGGMLPGILNGLGLRDRVTFLPMDRDGFDRIVLPSVSIDVPVGWPGYRERLMRALPDEANGVTRFLDACSAVAEANRARLLARPDSADAAMPMAMLRWGRLTLTQLFDRCGLSPKARTVLAAQSGNYGASPAQTLVVGHAVMIDDYLRGAYYPAGGGQTLVAALVEGLEAHGGALRTRARVGAILTENGRVTGVELDDGSRISAQVVVSNADYRRTILDLGGGTRTFPTGVVERATAATMRLPMASVYVALDRELAGLPNANIWWWASEDIEASYDRLYAGDPDEIPFAFLSFSSVKDPRSAETCPPGHANFQIMTARPAGHEAWGLDDGSGVVGYRRERAYMAAKRRFTERMLDTAESAIGPFRDRIVHLETATTLTQERYTLSTGGTPYGMATWGRLGMRPDLRTSVDGLYLAGQNTRFGSGITGVAISGIACASSIMDRPLLPDVHRGAVLADPALLPVREDSWDPLRISRGAARRDARGLAKIAARSAS